MATASGIVVTATCASITTKHTKSISGGYDYYTGQTTFSAVYAPSTMVASGGVAFVTRETVSARGRGADSSTAGDRLSSPAAALGSSPSQDRSVDFLHSTTLVISRVRLPTYMYYSKIDFTHKLDQTTVMVGAPSMLAISTSPASAGVSPSTWATTGSTAPVVAEGSGLLSSVDARGSPATVACRAISSTTSSMVGAGLRLLSDAPPTVYQFSLSR
jgi:hypothetical protein